MSFFLLGNVLKVVRFSLAWLRREREKKGQDFSLAGLGKKVSGLPSITAAKRD